MKASGLDSQLNAKWARVRGRLRSEYGEQAYRSWLKPLTLVGHTNGEFRIAVPTRFIGQYSIQISWSFVAMCSPVMSVST